MGLLSLSADPLAEPLADPLNEPSPLPVVAARLLAAWPVARPLAMA